MHYPEYNIIEKYPVEQTIGFTSTSADWGIFSNFAKTPIVVKGIEFSCVEQLFHYIRLNNEEERAAYLKLIPNMGLKMKAKAFAKRGIERADWREIAVDVMRFCLNHKFQSSEEFRKALSDSGNKYIVEDESNRKNRPDSWGAVFDVDTNEYYGKNIMGRLLMELREKGMLEYTKFEF